MYVIKITSRKILFALLLMVDAIAVLAPCVYAQTTRASSQKPPTFEVASVKPNTSGSAAWSMAMPPGGRLNFTNATVDAIIRWAYRLQEFQLVGAPSWTSSDHFDIVAKAAGNPPPDESSMQLMMQSLLA